MRSSLARNLVLIAITAFALAPSGGPIEGHASVIDGDTIEIYGQRIRLAGIDAPESDQLCRDADSNHYRCGQKASNDLAAFIDRRPVTCIDVDRDRYGRTVAVCTVAGVDLADWLVRGGLGHGIAKATTLLRRRKPNVAARGYGPDRSSNHGTIGRVQRTAAELIGVLTRRLRGNDDHHAYLSVPFPV
ncbi:thermonuclease family protein [Nitrobacteraceae bacterium UC4446_H13]